MPIFLLKNWKLILVVSLIAAAGISCYTFGYNVAANKYQLKLVKAEKKAIESYNTAVILAREKQHAQTALTEVQSMLHAELEKEAEVIYRENIKEIIKYRDNPDAGKCVLPDQFVRSYDAATAGRSVSEITETASVPQNNTVRVRDTEVLQNYVLNITECRKWRRELVRWNEWYNNAEEQFNAE